MQNDRTDFIAEQTRDRVRLIWLRRGPANALHGPMIAELGRALANAGADPAVGGIVLAAEGAVFCAGADPSELTRTKGSGLAELCRALETGGKPVVAALQGNAFGAGLELALAAHARIALPAARLALPEVALGLVPAAGATQRLPRLVGAAPALRLLTQGAPLTAAEALAIGLVDHVVEDHLIDRAIALASELATRPLISAEDRREGMRDMATYRAALTTARARAEAGRMPAPIRLVECVEAAVLLPYEMGLAFERAAFEDMVASPEAQALMHAFQAERRALQPPPALAGRPAPRLATLGLWGGGGALADVARQALSAGLKVVLATPDRATLVAALERIAARQEEMVTAGQLSPAARDADWGRLTGTTGIEALSGADLVLHTPEAGAAALPATLPRAALGDGGGLSFFPAPATGLLSEVVIPEGQPPEPLALTYGLARRLGGKVVTCGAGGPLDARLRATLARVVGWLEGQGHARDTVATALAAYGIGAGARGRLPAPPPGSADLLAACLAALACEGLRLMDEGTTPRAGDIDAAATISGLFPRWEGGPMYQAQRRGLMVLRADLRARAATAPALFTPPPLLDRLIAEGRRLE